MAIPARNKDYCQSGSWGLLSKVSKYSSIDLSGASNQGPDGSCTRVLNTKRLDHVFELESDSLLLLNGYMATSNAAGNAGGLCLFVNGNICSVESMIGYVSGSASCIVPVSSGSVRIQIIGAHSYGLDAFKVGYAVLPM